MAGNKLCPLCIMTAVVLLLAGVGTTDAAALPAAPDAMEDCPRRPPVPPPKPSAREGVKLSGSWRFWHGGEAWTEMKFERHPNGEYSGTVLRYLKSGWTKFRIVQIRRLQRRVVIRTRFVDNPDSKVILTLRFRPGGLQLHGTIQGTSYGGTSMSIRANRLR